MMRGAGIVQRLPLPLSLAALIVTVVAVTPPGQAASRTVRAALFADDAGSVGGIRVSRTPRANHLLVLDRDGRYPRAVVPPTVGAPGPQGPAGARGPQGPDGRAGGQTVVTMSNDIHGVSRFGDDAVVVASLADLPPGSWLVLAQNTGNNANSAAPLTCAISEHNRVLGASTATVGRGNGGARIAPMFTLAGWSSPAPSALDLACSLGGAATGDAGAEHILFGAIRVGSLEVRRQGP